MHNYPYDFARLEVWSREAGLRKAQLNGTAYLPKAPRKGFARPWQRLFTGARRAEPAPRFTPDRECC